MCYYANSVLYAKATGMKIRFGGVSPSPPPPGWTAGLWAAVFMYCIARTDRKDIYSPRPVFWSAISHQDCDGNVIFPRLCLLSMLLLFVGFRSVLVSVCVSWGGGNKQNKSRVTIILCSFLGGVFSNKPGEEQFQTDLFACTDNLIFRGNLFHVR